MPSRQICSFLPGATLSSAHTLQLSAIANTTRNWCRAVPLRHQQLKKKKKKKQRPRSQISSLRNRQELSGVIPGEVEAEIEEAQGTHVHSHTDLLRERETKVLIAAAGG